MNILIVLVFANLAASLSAIAQKTDAFKVPVTVIESFSGRFPGTTSAWTHEDEKYEGSSIYKGKVMSALFEPKVTMTESEIGIKPTGLHDPVLSYNIQSINHQCHSCSINHKSE